jgi:hypothetical protein
LELAAARSDSQSQGDERGRGEERRAGLGSGSGMDSEMAEEAPAAARGGAGQLAAVAEEEGEGAVAGAEEVAPAVGSSKTMERVAAAKKFIEDHYKAQMKTLQERKERYWNPNPSSEFSYQTRIELVEYWRVRFG